MREGILAHITPGTMVGGPSFVPVLSFDVTLAFWKFILIVLGPQHDLT